MACFGGYWKMHGPRRERSDAELCACLAGPVAVVTRQEHGKCGGADCSRHECVGKKVFRKQRRVPCGAGSQSGADRVLKAPTGTQVAMQPQVPALQRELRNAQSGTKEQVRPAFLAMTSQ